jgi:RsiW-degrading membrane proteinase PrsW (M82 family)
MHFLIILFAPVLFWAAYHYYHDRHKPEPLHYLFLTYVLGIGAGYLSTLGYQGLTYIGLDVDVFDLAQNNKLGLLLYSVFVIGVEEELIKFLPFWLICIRLHHFDEPIDGIIYASFIALGFATHENYYYLQILHGLEAIGRAAASPLVHILFSSIWGYFCSRAIMRKKPLWPAALMGVALAAVVHGLYDFAALSLTPWVHIAPPIIMLLVWAWRMYLIKKLQGG